MSARSILLISGSVRVGSVNTAVLSTVAELIPAQYTPLHYRGLGELPHFNPDLDRDPLPSAVVELREAIAAASAVLVSTPEYAGAMPGALKNLLEWTVGGIEITGKPTGWINPSTGPTGAEGTYASLRTVLAYTDAAIVEAACADVPVSRSQIGADGRISDAGIRARFGDVIDALTASIG
jgi:NAD(P)H-dependent FMN reductase